MDEVFPLPSNESEYSNENLTQSGHCLLFRLGTICCTTAALTIVNPQDILVSLKRHCTGDWGSVCKDDWQANDEAVKTGERILSVYQTSAGHTFWIITEADRSVTTILLPDDY